MYSGRRTGPHACGTTVAGLAATVVFCLAPSLGVPSAQAAGPCPNEALRAESNLNPETQMPLSMQLPDCRAYELVSPPYEEGYANIVVQAVSGDGDRMIVKSFGTFAELASEDGFGSSYELVRTGSGWVAHNLTPNRAQFPVQEFNAASRDLTRSVWVLREPSQSLYAKDLYVRESDGSFVKVGPMLPPSLEVGTPAGYNTEQPEGQVNYVGASSNLSDVLFTISNQGAYWPFDTTIQTTLALPSLYEYSEMGNSEPALVGVTGGAGDDTLISQCGTVLGGEKGDTYNAVSGSGSGTTVYFTAEHRSAAECPGGTQPTVNELYARIGGSETVAISEPSATQCSTCHMSVKEPAEFQGASEDGSKVFFLTEQELFAGDTTMNLYEYDFDNREGEKIVRVSTGADKPEVQGVARVSQDGSHVYFVARGILTTQPGPSLPAGEREAVAGADNLYLFERDSTYPQGHVVFVATLCSGSEKSGVVSDPQCHGESDTEDWTTGGTRPVQATSEGRFLVFQSFGDLTSGDTSAGRQIFEYDAAREDLVRVSVGQKSPTGYECPTTHMVGEGYNCDGNTDELGVGAGANIQEPVYHGHDFPTTSETGLAVSSDGSYVFFTSPDGLTLGALDRRPINTFGESEVFARNVYEYHSTVDAPGGSIAEGNVYLISDGRDLTLTISGETSGVELFGTDVSGEDVFFSSSDQLVGQDTDTQFDVYDARVDGGFPAPVSPVECEGEGCLPGAGTAPLFGSAVSSSVAGGGNLSPPPAMSPPVGEVKTKAKPLTRAQKLANALRACNKQPRKQRAACRARAEKRFGGRAKAKKSGNGGGR